ncbi:dihydrofolate reductase family protein [Micromonospora zamorensis]|uniref:Dihydrofolate reductase family protein n=2 Tax=Micromonospora zamorensis TaxID=709883 RepID=A0ABZ1PQQ9_9ACTN
MLDILPETPGPLISDVRQNGAGPLHAGLLDELLLFTHPVILGTGRPLFDRHDRATELDLLEQRSFDEGVTLHRYAVRRQTA